MRAASLLALGFAVPTLLVVTAVRLSREAGAGGALDGLAAGLWFASLFLVAGRLGVHLGWRGGPTPPGREHREVLGGVAAGVLTWGLLWLVWALPLMGALREASGGPFAVNSTAMIVAALAVAAGRHRSARAQAVPVRR